MQSDIVLFKLAVQMRNSTGVWLLLLAGALFLVTRTPPRHALQRPAESESALLLRRRREESVSRLAVERSSRIDAHAAASATASTTAPAVTAAAVMTAATHSAGASAAGTERPFFGAGQSREAAQSVATAIEKQRQPKEGALWGNVQASWTQAERESDNVRRLLQARDTS